MLAQRPPMGWNSFDCYNAAVTEAEMLENAHSVALMLLPAGYDTVVLDYCWSHPTPPLLNAPDQLLAADGTPSPLLVMDEWGRLLPAENRFPSAMNGAGLRPLADAVHALGLKFGIHIMRGIPRQAVLADMPVFGTSYRASQIADKNSICRWLNQMWGIDMTHPGGQAYYDSLFALYAEWTVDYIKVDDISYPYAAAEIEGVRKAIQKCGRDMVLSLSPGPTPRQQAEHVTANANLWRISGDFWDTGHYYANTTRYAPPGRGLQERVTGRMPICCRWAKLNCAAPTCQRRTHAALRQMSRSHS